MNDWGTLSEMSFGVVVVFILSFCIWFDQNS